MELCCCLSVYRSIQVCLFVRFLLLLKFRKAVDFSQCFWSFGHHCSSCCSQRSLLYPSFLVFSHQLRHTRHTGCTQSPSPPSSTTPWSQTTSLRFWRTETKRLTAVEETVSRSWPLLMFCFSWPIAKRETGRKECNWTVMVCLWAGLPFLTFHSSGSCFLVCSLNVELTVVSLWSKCVDGWFVT